MESALDAAIRRLERAAAQLEARMNLMLQNARAEAGDLFDRDRAKLAADLDESRSRERELRAAGEEAARALDRAIDEIRAALGGEDAPRLAEARDGGPDDEDLSIFDEEA